MRRIRNSIDVDEQDVGRWLISYADFITLLFAFFVIMYSISQVNSDKYKILSESLEGAFASPPKSSQIISIGQPDSRLQPITDNDVEQPEIDSNALENDQVDSENFATSEAFKELEKGLEASLEDLIDQQLAEINSDANWINIVLKSALLFPSGSDTLNSESEPLMEEVAKHLNKNNQLILVHGHTDNIPINTAKFPSNWELSSSRAVAVVRKLQNLNVQPNRLSVQGHGEFQPLAENNSSEGRRENRRVVIAISRKQRAAEVITIAEQGQDVKQTEQLTGALTAEAQQQQVKDEEPEYEIIKLPGGGILIRGKQSPESETSQINDDASQN